MNAAGAGPASAASGSVTPLPPSHATYVALSPTRILDTRYGNGLSGPIGSHAAQTFQVSDRGGVPANATAATGNLTVTAQSSSGYLYLGPAAMNDPTSSTLNFPLGDDRANGVTVALGPAGTLSVTFVGTGAAANTHVIFDVTGFFAPDASGATYVPLTPSRILDSRSGNGLYGLFSSHAARTFGVSGRGGVPANATAVTGNVTVTAQSSSGYLYVGPDATNDPTSSTLNFPKGDDRANGLTVALGSGGTLSITYVAPSAGPTAYVIFDVTGYFVPDASGASYVPLFPTRILDTRSGNGLSGPFSSHAARTFGVTGRGGVPANATAVTGNVTVTAQTSSGYLYLGPDATNDPTSSTLNFPLGDDRANGVTVAIGSGGTLSITYVAPSGGPTAHAILDVTGYFVP
jgi:serine protease inhibitor ecotin